MFDTFEEFMDDVHEMIQEQHEAKLEAIAKQKGSKMTRSEELMLEMISRPYTFPGCYRLLARMDDGEVMSLEGVKQNRELIRDSQGDDGWGIVELFVHWEGEPLICCQTGKELTSEYGYECP
tara:strand:- start:185 stop:550 length:366 start_codon:yes stop_codon:yes gene_type:complete